MTVQHDLERAVRDWVAQGSEHLPDPALDAALQEISMTPQRRASWRALRFPIMNRNVLRLGVAAVALIAAVIVGVRFLPSVGGPAPTPTPIPTPVTLASGSFTAPFASGATIDISATGSGANVSGVLSVSDDEDGEFSVDLQCTRTADIGVIRVILIGGDIVPSTQDPEGGRVAIALQPATPVKAILWFEDQPPAASCMAFLESIPDDVAISLQPVDGNVELPSSQEGSVP
jgi:hypothetical protein